MAAIVGIIRTVTIIEIRAGNDRNRLLATYDPACHVLRLFHRGETMTVELPPPHDRSEPVDVRLSVE
jgi:hypothetical protein